MQFFLLRHVQTRCVVGAMPLYVSALLTASTDRYQLIDVRASTTQGVGRTPWTEVITYDIDAPTVQFERQLNDGQAVPTCRAVFVASSSEALTTTFVFELFTHSLYSDQLLSTTTTSVGVLTLEDLQPGESYVLSVRGVDLAGNAGDAQTASWSSPSCPLPGDAVATAINSVSVGFGTRYITWGAPASDAVNAVLQGYEYAVDDGPPIAVDGTALFTVLYNVSGGQHTFTVRSVLTQCCSEAVPWVVYDWYEVDSPPGKPAFVVTPSSPQVSEYGSFVVNSTTTRDLWLFQVGFTLFH